MIFRWIKKSTKIFKSNNQGIPEIGHPNDKNSINLDVSKVKNILGLEKITEPKEQIEKLIQKKLSSD